MKRLVFYKIIKEVETFYSKDGVETPGLKWAYGRLDNVPLYVAPSIKDRVPEIAGDLLAFRKSNPKVHDMDGEYRKVCGVPFGEGLAVAWVGAITATNGAPVKFLFVEDCLRFPATYDLPGESKPE